MFPTSFRRRWTRARRGACTQMCLWMGLGLLPVATGCEAPRGGAASAAQGETSPPPGGGASAPQARPLAGPSSSPMTTPPPPSPMAKPPMPMGVPSPPPGMPGPDAGASSGPVQPAPDAGPPPAPPADPSARLYAQDQLPHFELELPPSSIAALRSDPRTYAPGSLRVGAERIENIGIRLKGEGSFRELDEKAAFKLKFDKFVDDQAFLGLRRVTLNNMVEDPSFLAERLAYHVFRTAELPAPRCNSALVSVNGELYGVYANIEAEDKTFLRRWFDDDDGNLYEEGQADFTPGAQVQFDLETNEDENDRSDLARMIQVFTDASDETLLQELDGVLDVEHFLRFTAAEAAVNQWDMYAYTVFYPNNFRLYHDPVARRFVFIPWGMDMSMKPYRDSGRPHIKLFGLAHQYDRPERHVSAGLIFQRCLRSEDCARRLRAAHAELADHYESLQLEALAERYHAQIREHVLSDPRSEYSRAEFERGYQSLLQTIRERPAAMREDLAGR